MFVPKHTISPSLVVTDLLMFYHCTAMLLIQPKNKECEDLLAVHTEK